MARYKGFLTQSLHGAGILDDIKDKDKILISEGCTHHRQCDDIGTVKLPKLIGKHTDAKPEYTFTSGGEFPQNLSEYKLIIHCGACMLSEREMIYRASAAKKADVPMTNFGIAISHMQGILKRAVKVFG
jgi:predicted GTPase